MHLAAQLLVSAMLVYASPLDPPTVATVACMAEIGLTPESALVAGFTGSEFAAMVDNMGTNSESLAALATAHATIEARAAAVGSAEAAATASPSSTELRAAVSAARAQLSSAQAALVELRTSLRASVLSSASEAQRTAVATYLASAGRSAPPEFKAVSRSEAQWRALEAALRAEARAARRNVQLDAEQASLLSAARSDAAVQAAKSRLDAGLAGAKQAFTPSTQQQQSQAQD